jgi:hypothetical protein
MIRRLHTEDWTHYDELRFLAATRLHLPGSPEVPRGAKAYAVFGRVVLHEVYVRTPFKATTAAYIERSWRLTRVRDLASLRSLP